MTEPLHPASEAQAVRSALVCRLRPKQRRRPSPTAGEVELENASAEVLEIQVRNSRLQYLDLVVTDASGNVVSTGFYSDLLCSPVVEAYTWRFEPGEKYTHNVWLLATVPPEQQQPGTYTVRAVYDCPGHRAVSDPLTVTLAASDTPEAAVPPTVPAAQVDANKPPTVRG